MSSGLEKLSENEKKFLRSLVEDGNKTDAQIAKETGMSKATANRIRRRFEDDGTLQEYIPVIRLEEVGVELYALFTVRVSETFNRRALAQEPNIIFLGDTDDFEDTVIAFAGFADYEDYHGFVERFKDEHSDGVESFETQLIAPHNIVKDDFTHLIKHTLSTALKEDEGDA